ncbi:MAG: 5'-methylthioadenosine/S-adenosylhomocysteine nucleosidase [Cyanosarcina radialis HA8281-LM2]|jgi:adenosylhomocysteine nucleosidase|nr:5'-methylthioadenosine/S-adenosylhomocysteine nucleosidase [Cyanosarcina radialis HA8281-LM2]
MKTAILTPLQEELTILVDGLEQFGLQKRELRAGNLSIFEFSEVDLLVACGGQGKTQFGIQAQYLLCQVPQIQLLVCAGAAGALSDSLDVGDVVVATETVEHDYHLKFVSRPLPRFAGARPVIKVLQNLPQTDSAFSVHFGAVASGDEDIVDVARGRELMNKTDCVAVAWEGAGGARACRFNQKCYVELRGVTDTADRQAAADFEANLVTAMHNLVQVIIQWRATLQPNGAVQQVAAPEQ